MHTNLNKCCVVLGVVYIVHNITQRVKYFVVLCGEYVL